MCHVYSWEDSFLNVSDYFTTQKDSNQIQTIKSKFYIITTAPSCVLPSIIIFRGQSKRT